MAVGLHPPELAALIDAAERPRARDWSFRAALTRYGQPQPERTSAVIELLRRIEHALKPRLKQIETNGHAIWAAVDGEVGATEDGDAETKTDGFTVDLLRALVELDRLGDVLAAWAVERAGARPDAMVDAVVADVAARLEALGVAREERPRPSGRRG